MIWDIGCGSGAMTAYFAEKVGENGHVYAVDISEKQLEVTKKRIESGGFTNVTFIRADIVSDNFPTGAADVVYIRFVLMHLTNPNLALDKIKDLLKPQGIFVSEEPINSSCYSPTSANSVLKEYINAYIVDNYYLDMLILWPVHLVKKAKAACTRMKMMLIQQ